MSDLKGESKPFPTWHRSVYALAAAPLLLFTLMGWEEGGAILFGVPTLICIGLACRPTQLAAALLFWPFAALASLYGYVLLKDLVTLWRGGPPSVLLNATDSLVFLLVEAIFLAVAGLLFVMWRAGATRSGGV